MQKNRARYQRSRTNRWSMLLITVVVILILAVVFYGRQELIDKLATKTQEQDFYENRLKDLKQEAEDIEAYQIYTQTTKFIEETAKQKLGLVYEDEIIIREAK
jgi:cell division protein FtsB